MRVTSNEPVFIDADGDEVTLTVVSGSAVELRKARFSAAFQTVSIGGSVVLRSSCWAVSSTGVAAEVSLFDTVAQGVAVGGTSTSPDLVASSTTFNVDGTVANRNVNGVVTSYAYSDGVLVQKTRNGKTASATYTPSGQLSGITVT